MALVDLLRGRSLRAPRAFVPDRDGAGAVMAFRDRALERTVAQRMVFHLHREMLDRRIARRPLRHGPAAQYAADLQAQVEMAAARVVQMDHELAAGSGGTLRAGGRGRFRRVLEVALASIRRKPCFRTTRGPASCHASKPS